MQPFLERCLLERPNLLEKVDVFGAAAEEDVLAVVQLHARVRINKGKGAPAEVVAALNQGDGDAAFGEGACGGKAGKPPANHHAVATRSIGM